MASKRQPSKQRRQSQNQKQRAELAARREAAAASPPPTKDAGTSSKKGVPESSGTGASASSGGSASGSGSVLARFRGASSAGRAARTSGTGSLPVGHRAALSAVFAAVAAAIVGSFLFKVPVDYDGDAITTKGALIAEWTTTALDAVAKAPDATPEEIVQSIDDWMPNGDQPYLKAFWPTSAAVVLPVIGTALGFRAVSRRSSAKVVNRTMYVTLFGSLLTSQLLLIYLPAVISLGVASFQVRKAETAMAAATASDAPADVIDVDAVEDED
jgi:hypothetical protein